MKIKKKQMLGNFDEEMDEFTKQIMGDNFSEENTKKSSDNNSEDDLEINEEKEDPINDDNMDADEYKKYMDELIRKEEEKVANMKMQLHNERERQRLEHLEKLKSKKAKHEKELNDMKLEQERKISEILENCEKKYISNENAQKQIEEIIEYYKRLMILMNHYIHPDMVNK